MECNGKRTPRDPSHHPILTVCEVFRVGATGKENENTMSYAREMQWGGWSERKQCDCDGSRWWVVIGQRVRQGCEAIQVGHYDGQGSGT